ncbi:MAG: DUF445 domain-containing protein [Capnocytophaga sp.]|nr:DUF445 domain-containing protein [Capnocytophaga sp.]
MKTKKEKLRYHKRIATALFIAMAILYTIMVFWQKNAAELTALGYIKAFAEAAMVGALADWFAVTALFNKPLGLPIPHTNLIENRKKDIGDNLGGFVVDNFLNPESIRPYVQQIQVSGVVADWLSKDANIRLITREIHQKWSEFAETSEDGEIAKSIASKSRYLLDEIKINTLAGDALAYVLQKGEHQKLFDFMFRKIEGYITENKAMVREKVAQESLSFIPRFVNDMLADKITSGLATYIGAIADNPQHKVRKEIENQLNGFTHDLHHLPRWQTELEALKESMLGEEKINKYSQNIWQYIKKFITDDLAKSTGESSVKGYLHKTILRFAENLRTDTALQQRLDGQVRKTAYQFVLKNRGEVGHLISRTVGNWQGRALSEKLELEVGKDLQFIRINGTLVGGLVGLLIYCITQWLL